MTLNAAQSVPPAVVFSAEEGKDYTFLVLLYTAITVILKITVFTGTSIVDTFGFLAMIFSLYVATSWKTAKWAQILIFVLILVVLIPYVGVKNTFYLDVVTQVGIFAALALGLNIVVGFAGLLDLGFVAFFAIGVYVWAIFGSAHGNIFFHVTSFPLASEWFFVFLIIALVAAALFGVLLGLPVLRLRGDYLAIVTLGFGEVIRVLANNLDKESFNLTNGPQGIASIGQPLSGLALALQTEAIPGFKWQALIYYVLVLCVIGLAIFVTTRLDQSKIGRSWIALREDEIAAQAMGIPLLKTKLIAFATGASFAGVMGAIFAAKQTFVSPESFDFNQSIGVLAMVVFGGLGSIRGAIVGAALVTILNVQILKAFSVWLNNMKAAGVEIFGFALANLPPQFEPSKYERLIFGLILILMMLYRPQGLVPAKRQQRELTALPEKE
jgi:branched-chain amino acid transport system permease protein